MFYRVRLNEGEKDPIVAELHYEKGVPDAILEDTVEITVMGEGGGSSLVIPVIVLQNLTAQVYDAAGQRLPKVFMPKIVLPNND